MVGMQSARRRMILLVGVVALVCAGAARAANPTTLSINCTPKGVSPGAPTSCAATVTDAGPVASRVPPAGSVSFTTDGEGSFDAGDTCTLEPSGAFSSRCTVSYTPTAISGGSHRLSGTYNGEEGHGRATSAFTLTVTPVNDDITTATAFPVPGKVIGTTEGATYSDSDPELCSDAYAPVWYSLKPARSGRVAIRLTVKGQVDAIVAVFRQERSKLVDLGCDVSGASGVAGVPFDATAGTAYVIAVAAPWSATAGEFTLDSSLVPPVTFPGQHVAQHIDLRLDPLLRPSAALSVPARAGTTYRIDATAPSSCVHVELLRTAVVDSDVLAESDGCSGYLVFTPTPGSSRIAPLLVSLPEGTAATVHVAVRPVQNDDLAPGAALLTAKVVHGRLAAHQADAVDIYNFRVLARSDATLELRGAVHSDLLLFDQKGNQIACACDGTSHATLVHSLDPGVYLAAVRARPGETGAYTILLRLRQPTSTTVTLAATDLTSQLAVFAGINPTDFAGRVTLELQRFDPLSKWQPVATVDHAVANGHTTFTLVPRQGAWRVRAIYRGTLSASPSVSNWITFTIETRTGADRHPAPCGTASTASFTVGSLLVRCGGAGFGGTPASSAGAGKTPSAELRSLRATVEGLATLKEPFKSQLIEDINSAIEALASKNPDEAHAQLDAFVTTVQSAPVTAQLTAAQRTQLITAAKQIETRIAS
jgi:hypothetical protein